MLFLGISWSALTSSLYSFPILSSTKCNCSNYVFFFCNSLLKYELLQPLAPICEVCGTAKPKLAKAKYMTWSCKFCTLENSTKLDKCSACDQWRYSYGPPISNGPSYDWDNIEGYNCTVSAAQYYAWPLTIFSFLCVYYTFYIMLY